MSTARATDPKGKPLMKNTNRVRRNAGTKASPGQVRNTPENIPVKPSFDRSVEEAAGLHKDKRLTLPLIAIIQILRSNPTKYALPAEAVALHLPKFGIRLDVGSVFEHLVLLASYGYAKRLKYGWRARPAEDITAPAAPARVDAEFDQAIATFKKQTDWLCEESGNLESMIHKGGRKGRKALISLLEIGKRKDQLTREFNRFYEKQKF